MRILWGLMTMTGLSLSVFPQIGLAQNAQLQDNASFFTGQPPVLVSAETVENSVRWPDAHYYFIFNLPKNSVESLGKVTIQQQVNVETIQFNLANTHAFQGTQNNSGQALPFKVVQDSQTNAIAVIFDPPISPGTTFSIRLEANQNPNQSGVYLFNVMTFPAGSNPVGLDMGVGRLSFYQNF